MLTGVCRYRIVDEVRHADGYVVASVDWSDFEDYATEDVDSGAIGDFRETAALLRSAQYAGGLEVLDQLPIEQVVNNLVLVVNLDIDNKQRLLESPRSRSGSTIFENARRRQIRYGPVARHETVN